MRILFIFIFFVTASVMAFENKADLGINVLKGNVSRQTKIIYQVDKNGKVVNAIYKEIYKYDRKANITELLKYNKYKILESKIIYKYNENGKILESEELVADGAINYKSELKYDNYGNEIECLKYIKGKLVSKDINKYNSLNLLVEKSGYSESKELFKSVYGYDINGNKIKAETFYNNDSMAFTENYKYDKNGKLVEISEYENGNLNSKIIYEYDVNGNKIETKNFNKDAVLISKEIYKYDERKNLVSKCITFYNDKNNEIQLSVFKYNDIGNVIEEKIAINESWAYKIIYNYDITGNLTECKVFITENDSAIEKLTDFMQYKYEYYQ